MQIFIDSREQAPLDFVEARVGKPIVKKLDFGDYACMINGRMVPTVFERKSVGDLFGTLGKGYTRFKKEYLRAEEAENILILIVECTLSTLTKGYKYSRIPGPQIENQMFSLLVKHNIWPVFTKNRAEMARYIENFYMAVERSYS